MANILEYTLMLNDKMSGTLKKIGVNSDEALDIFSSLQKQTTVASKLMDGMGKSVGTLNTRLSALRAEKNWIPASDVNTLKAYNKEIGSLEKEIRRLENTSGGGRFSAWKSDLMTAFPIGRMLTNPIVLLGAAIYKLNSYTRAGVAGYEQESIAIAKLGQVMKNTMGARQEDVNAIVALTAAQQKLGVIGDETQLAGSQELATYVTKRANLEKLIPVMNDMLAQQYGINSTQEQAITIAQMMGKVMDGQVGALSRYGYRFNEAQEKILKYGTEAQRAATLADVVTSAVGGVNESLAKTPLGEVTQLSNNFSDLQERVGGLRIFFSNVFNSFKKNILSAGDSVVTFFEINQNKIAGFLNLMAKLLGKTFNLIIKIINAIGGTFSWFFRQLREEQPIIVTITAIMASLGASMLILTVRAKALAAWSAIVAGAKTLWAAAQTKLNLAMTANPVGLIIAGIVALIGTIAYVVYKTDGWAKQWEAVTNFMKFTFFAFVESVKLAWNTMINGIMVGLDFIKLGWYKFKEAVGLGNSNENHAIINQINNDMRQRQHAIIDGAAKVADYAQKAKDALKWELAWNNDRSLGDMAGGLRSRLGLSTNNDLITAVNGRSGNGSGLMERTGETTSSVATGGTKSTNINVNVKSFIENFVLEGSMAENQQEIERNMAEIFYRVLNIAQSSVS